MIILIWQTKTFASYLTQYRITIFIHSLIFKQDSTYYYNWSLFILLQN
jgi:hypothetical protein